MSRVTMTTPSMLLALCLSSLTLLHGEPSEKDTITSYAAIDERLVGEYLLSEDAVWRYKVGTAEPLNEEPAGENSYLDWTQLEYYDSDWQEGPGPLGYGVEGLGTVIEGMEGAATTVFMRHILDVYDPAQYEDVEFRCPVDDGFVFFINGEEQDRQHAGILLHVQHTQTASSSRAIDRLPVPEDELNGSLQAGPNPLAVIGLVHENDKETFEIRPQIYTTFRKNEEEDRLRGKRVRKRLAGDRAEALGHYLDARLHQRAGRHGEALELFLAVAQADPEDPAPWKRAVECARVQGELSALAATIEERIRDRGTATPALLDTYTRLILEDLGQDVTRIAGSCEGLSDTPTHGDFADALWTAEHVRAEQALRIDCGAEAGRGTNGSSWSRDRLYTYGKTGERGGSGVRIAERAMGEYEPLYRIPVPAGCYELRLTFRLDPKDAVDVLVNDTRAVRMVKDGVISIPVRTYANRLDLDLVARTEEKASISGIEVRPMDSDEFAALAASWLELQGPEDAYALVQNAGAQLELDDRVAALASFEQAEPLSGFSPEAADRLAVLRDSLLPSLLSYASADDMATRRRAEAERIADAAAEAASSEREEAYAMYLRGRIDQLAGRLDDATITFEELAFSGGTDLEPYLRMAECLKQADLAPEAEDILRTALEGDAPVTPALLRFWISMALDELGRDPWDVVADLAQLPTELPEHFTVVPTSEECPRPWQYLPRQPPTVKWSQTSFSARDWNEGHGSLGWGSVPNTTVRLPWEGAVMYARTPFSLPGRKLLYPHARVSMNDAGDVYLNGTIACRLRGRTSGYDLLPMREGSFSKGDNFVGFYAFNIWDESHGDVGIVEPLGLLVRVHRALEEGVLRINCGGSDYTDSQGQQWHGDRFFGHGTTHRVAQGEDSPAIQGTSDDELYRTQRGFSVRHTKASFYHLPVPNGKYAVTLHFAEADPRFEEPGKRQFGVKLEDTSVLEAFDTAGELGYATAGARTFETIVEDGWLDLDFAHVKGKSFPSVSALEIRPVE